MTMADTQADKIRRAQIGALRIAGQWVLAESRQLINIQTGLDGPGSPAGTPPFKRTGYGQEMTGYEETENGCRVGVYPMDTTRAKSKGILKMPGRNYMAGHDTGIGVRAGEQRPWLRVFADERRPEVDRIVRRYFETLLNSPLT